MRHLFASVVAAVAWLFAPGLHAQGAAKPPIKVGAISSTALFPESVAAVRAYLDVVNENGGVQGRKLVLLAEDDRVDPAAAAQAARKLVDVEGVLAHVGSASALECAVNAAFYRERGLVSVQGTGVDPVCFNSRNIAPVNAGPYLATALGLQFLTEVRHRQRVCAVAVAYAPVQKAAFEQEVQRWSRRAGKQLAYVALGIAPTDDIALHVGNAIRAGCEGVVFTAVAPAVAAWVKAARAQRAGAIDWVFLTPAYTAEMIETLGADGEGVYVMSEFEPWSSRSLALTDWRQVMVKKGVPLTSLSQGGYAAAMVLVKTLRSIRGEITRDSVTQAFRTMEPMNVPLMGTPFHFGPAERHNPNRAAVPVQLQGGRWSIAHWNYILAPATSD